MSLAATAAAVFVYSISELNTDDVAALELELVLEFAAIVADELVFSVC